ncbi:MAG: DUF3592 domain-containing protein [Elusimicrobia bacterium]|nr:DUF3592 domain-containing protein [Elusimicrobiota bacterium]
MKTFDTLRKVILSGLVVYISTGLWLSCRNGHRSADWSTTVGQITESRLVSEVDLYRVEIRYTYEVAGKSYMGERVSSLGVFVDPGLVEKYPKGKTVTVTYNPSDPSKAVLEPGTKVNWPKFPLFALLVTVLMVLAAYQKKNSTSQGASPNPSVQPSPLRGPADL